MSSPQPRSVTDGTTAPTDQSSSVLGRLTAPLSATTAATIGLAALVLLLVAGFVLVDLSGHDLVPYVAFASGPAVASIIAALLGKRAAVMTETLDKVRHQTNGVMNAQFAAAADERSINEANRRHDQQAAVAQIIDQMPTVLPAQPIPPSTKGTTS